MEAPCLAHQPRWQVSTFQHKIVAVTGGTPAIDLLYNFAGTTDSCYTDLFTKSAVLQSLSDSQEDAKLYSCPQLFLKMFSQSFIRLQALTYFQKRRF